jgi:hypothetical protein
MGSQIIAQVVAVPGLQWTVSDDDSHAPSGPLFWIYVDQQGRWCLRREGGESEAGFGSRAEAVAFLRDVEGTSPYRVFIETAHGKVVLEQHGTLPSAPREPGEPEGVHQPETASRFNLSRTGLLKRWLSKFWS